MISLFHFANPLFLASFVVLPLIALAYRRRTPSDRKRVSSLFLLEHLPKRTSVRKRVKLPIRFFVELLVLSCLVFAAAVPYLQGAGSSIVVVVDASLSMKARDSGGAERFDAAKRIGREWVESQSWASRFTVFSAASTVERLGEGLSRGEASSLIDTIRLSPTRDSLGSSLEELLSSTSFDKVVVITDKERDGDAGGSPIEVLTVGELRRNVFIADARTTLSSRERSIEVEAGISSDVPQSVPVKIWRTSGPLDKNPTLLTSSIVELSPSRIAKFSLPLEEAPAQLYRVQLDVGTPAASDAIREDNEAWISPDTELGSAIGVVTPAQTGSDVLGLQSIRSFRFSALTPEQYGALSAAQRLDYQAFIFHRAAPVEPPGRPALLILPPEGNSLFGVAQTVTSPKISSWAEAHPLTSYLRFSLLEIPSATLLAPPSWAQAVVNSERGALIAAGEQAGIRSIGVGFEVLPFEGKKNPVLTTLTLNMLSWLQGGTGSERAYVSGSVVELERGYRWTVTDPNTTPLQTARTPNGGSTFRLAELGVYTARGEPANGGELRSRFIPSNAFHPEEARTFVRERFAPPVTSARSGQNSATDRELWREFLWAALVLILLDLLIVAFARHGSKFQKQYC